MNSQFNWGIIGLGKMAHKFAEDLLLADKANLYGVASRSEEKAKAFGKKYKAYKIFENYSALAADPNIDIVYIATPHVFHNELTIMCLDEGKAVLCEKAFGMNKREVELMIEKAKEKKLFLMEALWTRFIPATEKVLDLLNEGLIGDIQMLKADFGFKADYDPVARLFNKKLGGGSLLDIGIYPVFLALLILGVPGQIKATAVISETGVDSSCAVLFNYKNGQLAVLDSTFLANTAMEGWVYGEKGALKMHNRFHHTQDISHFTNQSIPDTFNINYIGNGYYHEIIEVMNCLDAGKIESDKLPLSFSLDLYETLDRIRKEIGLSYDADQKKAQ